MTPDEARRLLDLAADADADAVHAARRRALRRVHPDRAGGDPVVAAAVNAAADLLLGVGPARRPPSPAADPPAPPAPPATATAVVEPTADLERLLDRLLDAAGDVGDPVAVDERAHRIVVDLDRDHGPGRLHIALEPVDGGIGVRCRLDSPPGVAPPDIAVVVARLLGRPVGP